MRSACRIVANLFSVREFLKKGADFCSMCGPHFCSMKITEDVRRYAKETQLMKVARSSTDCGGRLKNSSTAEREFILNRDE
jgi:hypothetical protein